MLVFTQDAPYEPAWVPDGAPPKLPQDRSQAKTVMNGPRLRRWILWALGAFGIVVLLNTIAFVVVLARDPLPGGGAPHAGPGLRNLPLVERTPARTSAAAPLVIYYTGDNGWQDGDLTFTEGLNRFGAPVVVVDSLHYFARERTADEAAADLARVIDRYSAVWGQRKIVLVGYSYGANVAPVLARRLPDRLRARLQLIAMIAPVGTAELVIRPWSLMDIVDDPFAFSDRSELAKLGGLKAVCIWGRDDHRAACPHLPPALATPAPVPGGHRFLDQRDAVARIIAEAAGMQVQPATQPGPSGGSVSP
ncbi:MAG TPA: AcvB/VirJ family lysyl-phosphatidylglycerol hydrolase [Caulobacteraceae bacterium]|nr:AcvB/VirJ family lysyl-phosphatidylglycerol hydrolase [Caulobacteraceae bacterium]